MRLIDADRLTKQCKEITAEEWNQQACPYSWAYAYENFIDDIEEQPTIDAVPVVRCKDCKWAEDTGPTGLYCNHPDGRNTIYCLPDEFCNCGERKEIIK